MTPNELLQAHLSMINGPAVEDLRTIYADDVVAEFPYAPEGHTRRLEGPEAVAGFVLRIKNFAEAFTMHQPTIHETPDGFVAEYRGESTFKDTGNRYVQDYVVVVKVRDGKIALWREHYDPIRVLRAMGEFE